MEKNKLKDMDLKEASDFWDEHDFCEFSDVKEDKGVRFRLSKKKYVGLDTELYQKIAVQARSLKKTTDDLIATWLRQKTLRSHVPPVGQPLTPCDQRPRVRDCEEFHRIRRGGKTERLLPD